jgi:hypothetical protein
MKTFGANSVANDVLALWFRFLLRIKIPHTTLRQDEQSLTQFFKKTSQVYCCQFACTIFYHTAILHLDATPHTR